MATVDNRFPTEGTQKDIEARLGAIETALASLMADTTGQSIASAISGLGATLGSDKANISGDNIARPATFRQNIGASKVSVIEVNVSGTTDTAGYYVAPYDYNEYFIGGRLFIRGESGCYAIFRPSGQNKVVIMVIDDTLNKRINAPIEGKLYYLAIT